MILTINSDSSTTVVTMFNRASAIQIKLLQDCLKENKIETVSMIS